MGIAEVTEVALENMQDLHIGCVGGRERKNIWGRTDQQEPGRRQREVTVRK